MAGSQIPTRSRQVVRERDRGICQRCGVAGNEYHHRRRRRVGSHDPHCPCNAATLCRACHAFVHAHPAEARENGTIVSAYCEEPWTVPIKTFAGWMQFTCDGDIGTTKEGSPP